MFKSPSVSGLENYQDVVEKFYALETTEKIQVRFERESAPRAPAMATSEASIRRGA